MVMHPQELEKAKEVEHENNLWWELDRIAVKHSERVPESTRVERMKKATAAMNMMSFLHVPTKECQRERYNKGLA